MITITSSVPKKSPSKKKLFAKLLSIFMKKIIENELFANLFTILLYLFSFSQKNRVFLCFINVVKKFINKLVKKWAIEQLMSN